MKTSKVRLNKTEASALTSEYSLALGHFCAMVFSNRGSRRLTDISHVTSRVEDQTFTKLLPVKYNIVYPGLFVVYLSTFSVTQCNIEFLDMASVVVIQFELLSWNLRGDVE